VWRSGSGDLPSFLHNFFPLMESGGNFPLGGGLTL